MRLLSRSVTFWLVVATLLVVMAASGAPSPLYVVYQQRLGFSSSTLTLIFAIYVLALLATLLTVGSLSDRIGRRPVLLASLTLEIVSLALFLPASSVGWLLAARTVQGIATGAAIGALGAALVDTQPAGSQRGTLLNSVAPGLGLALGALGAGALVQYAPAPTTTVFVVLIALVAVLLVALVFMPETTARQPVSLRDLRPAVRVSRDSRPRFLSGLPVFVASWSVGGLYLSLGGSIAAVVFGLSSHLVGGLVVAAMTGTGALASILLRATAPVRSMVGGSVALAIGLAITVSAIDVSSRSLFFAGTVIAGFGFGASFLGAFRTVLVAVTPDHRAATLSAVLIVSYTAFSVPAVIAGFAATRYGLRDTALVYGSAVIAVSVVAILIEAVRAGMAKPVRQPECPTRLAAENVG